jgi:hypothetical protein
VTSAMPAGANGASSDSGRNPTRPSRGVDELEYPAHDSTAVVTGCGRICYQARKINLSEVFAGQKVGVRIWPQFHRLRLGVFRR